MSHDTPKRKSPRVSYHGGHIDAATVKQVASGRWLDILAAAGISTDLLDGKGHPCPKCGGRDRFAVFKDVAETGGVNCRHCHAERNGDGLAAVAWIRGIDFPAAVRWVADYLRIDPQPQAHTDTGNPQPKGKRKPGQFVATYDYSDESGNVLMQVVRFDPKEFKQRRPDGKGGWTWKVKGVRIVPYRLSELIAEPTKPVFVAEGEKDCDNLARIGVLATCNAGGAEKWKAEHSAFLSGRRVIVLQDNDMAGRRHALQVAQSLQSIAESVRVIELPDLPDKGDASDWIAAGGTREELERLADSSPVWDSKPNDSGADKLQSTADQLVDLAKRLYRFGRTKKGEMFAVPRGGANVAVSFKGSNNALRSHLAYRFRAEAGRTPGASALTDALNVLAGEAMDAEAEPVYLRTARYDSSIVIDLGDTAGRAVVVRPSGWDVVERSPVLFRRTALTAAMPVPERGGSLDELRGLLNVSPLTWPLVLGWLIAAFIQEIPHPILLLSGLQGSGKSCAARILVRLIDDSAAPLRSEPRKLDDWQVAASGSWVVALDNISAISPWLADAMCRAATGDGLVKRALYSDDGLAVLAFKRVLILTSIDAGAIRGDLGERLLLADLEPIGESNRRTEQEIEAEFTPRIPRLLGALLDALAAVMAELPEVQLESMPRMADFARVLAACDRVGITNGALPGYLAQSGRIAADVVDGDPFAQSVVEYLGRVGSFSGTASELLKALLPDTDKVPSQWPKSNGVGGRLKRLKPALETTGVRVMVPDTRTSRGRIIELESIRNGPSLPSLPHQNTELLDVNSDDTGPNRDEFEAESDDFGPSAVIAEEPKTQKTTEAGDDGDGSVSVPSGRATEKASRVELTI